MNAEVIVLQPGDEEQQQSLGGAIASILPAGTIIFLHGDLGAGKTTLVRGYLRELGFQGAVKSPTYTLIEPYNVSGGSIFHLDLYRLADPDELEYLGIRDLLMGEATLLIEWPEQGLGALPSAEFTVRIAHRNEGRLVQISAASRDGNTQLIAIKLAAAERGIPCG